MDILAMPMLIGDDWVPKQVKTQGSRDAFLATYLPFATAVEEVPGAYTLFTHKAFSKNDTKAVYYFATTSTGELLYLMMLNPVGPLIRPDGSVMRSVFQGAVWRSTDMPIGAFRGKPAAIFWSLLRPGVAVVSDALQTQASKAFWNNRVIDAFSRGHTVEAIHIKPDAKVIDEVIEITDGYDYGHLWSPKYSQHRWRLCIRN